MRLSSAWLWANGALRPFVACGRGATCRYSQGEAARSEGVLGRLLRPRHKVASRSAQRRCARGTGTVPKGCGVLGLRVGLAQRALLATGAKRAVVMAMGLSLGDRPAWSASVSKGLKVEPFL